MLMKWLISWRTTDDFDSDSCQRSVLPASSSFALPVANKDVYILPGLANTVE